MSSKQTLHSLDIIRLRYYLNKLLELTGEGAKDAFLRDFLRKFNGRHKMFVREFPQKFNVMDDMKIKLSREGVRAVVAIVVGDGNYWLGDNYNNGSSSTSRQAQQHLRATPSTGICSPVCSLQNMI